MQLTLRNRDLGGVYDFSFLDGYFTYPMILSQDVNIEGGIRCVRRVDNVSAKFPRGGRLSACTQKQYRDQQRRAACYFHA